MDGRYHVILADSLDELKRKELKKKDFYKGCTSFLLCQFIWEPGMKSTYMCLEKLTLRKGIIPND